MDGVVFVAVFGKECERVALVELERVPRLWVDVHTDHVEAGAVIAHPGSACA